ncbi:MAG: serine/threonine protein kinase [Planctomycetota bacterium]|jgi:serine/threonine protein kinase
MKNNTLPPTSYPSGEDETAFPIHPPQIEGYKILSELGKAGQGRVWRALQLSTRREVALKVPRTGLLSSKKGLARFEREVELAARLKHPNIARIHDSGIHQDRYYYTMELVEGVPLDDYVEQHKLTQRQILELMRTICQAVQHAHQNTVIHRDIKPSNILVTEDGQPHIVDFGLAKYIPGEDLSKAISIDGEMVGTPAYMSPEQALGEMEKVDTRTDVYSLGAILFVLLTGKNLHDLSGARTDVLHRIAHEVVIRPRKIKPKIDKELEAVLLKSLAREPDERYASAGELAGDIDNYLNGRPLIAKAPTLCYFLCKQVRKYQRAIVIACLIVIAFSIGLFGQHTIKNVRRYFFQIRIAGNPALELTFGLYTSDKRRVMYKKFDPIIDYIEERVEYLLERPVDIDMEIFDT